MVRFPVEKAYSAISEGAILNPDQDMSGLMFVISTRRFEYSVFSDDDEGEWVFDRSEVEQNLSMLDHLILRG